MIYTHSAFDQLSVCALKKGENNRQRDLRHCSVDKDGARAAESVLGEITTVVSKSKLASAKRYRRGTREKEERRANQSNTKVKWRLLCKY